MKLQPYLFAIALAVTSPAFASDESTLAALHTLADQGNPSAQYHMGMLYNNGMRGAPRDPKLAFAWFQKSADGKDALAAYKLGCYFAGQFPGVVEIDKARAYSYKLIAANAGYSLAQADVALHSVERGDYAQAAAWWKLAADQGFAPAAYNLGTLYSQGRLGAINNEKAYAYVKLAQRLSAQRLSPAAEADLALLAAKLTRQELEGAAQFLAAWHEKPSDLTRRANAGVTEIALLLAAH